jgi:glucosamine kinase
MKLICDSGSSKASWVALNGDTVIRFEGTGLNPHILTVVRMEELLRAEVLTAIEGLPRVNEVFFYGAGCNPAGVAILAPIIEKVFGCKAWVDSDLTGSALSVLGKRRGVVAILGTGSNSGLFDSGKLVERVPALGYILGDEGSGAFLGRQLISDFFKFQMPEKLGEKFHQSYNLSEGDVIRNVYREPAPNRFLASFVPFIYEHRNDPYIQQLLHEGFQKLVNRNLMYYKQWGIESIAFTGSVAALFREELEQVLLLNGLTIDDVIRYPIDGLLNFYKNMYDKA